MIKTAEQKNRICFLNKHTAVSNEFKTHLHSCYEIIYFLSGGSIEVDGARYSVSKDTCCIIPPNTQHKELLQSDGEILFIGFACEDKSLFSKFCSSRAEPSIRLIFEQIIKEYSSQNYGYKAAAEALLEVLLISYVRMSGGRGVYKNCLHSVRGKTDCRRKADSGLCRQPVIYKEKTDAERHPFCSCIV